jgi:hypothetical protein
MLQKVEAVGWVAVAVLLAGALFDGWWSRPAAKFPELTEGQLAAFTALRDEQHGVWLTAHQSRHSRQFPAMQHLLVARGPTGQVLVVGNTHDDDGNPGAEGWPVPWAVVHDKLPARGADPLTFHGRHAGLHCVHHAVPLFEDGGLWLLMTQAAPAGGWMGRRGLMLVAAASLVVLLVAMRQAAN